MKLRYKSPEELKAQTRDMQLFEGELSQINELMMVDEGMRQFLASRLRPARVKREAYFRGPIDHFVGALPIRTEAEAPIIDRLRSRVIDVEDADDRQSELERSFPSGTFMFHGSDSAGIVKILRSGYLVNAHALGEGGADHGGKVGVSWSLGEIEAIPSARFHLAGFIASPEAALGTTSQLAIPEYPAPFEVLQLSHNIDAKKFFETFTQARMLETVDISFMNFLRSTEEVAGTDELNEEVKTVDISFMKFLLSTEDAASADELDEEIPEGIDQYVYRDDNGDITPTREFAHQASERGNQFIRRVWLEALGMSYDKLDKPLAKTITSSLEERIHAYAKSLHQDINNFNDTRVPIDKLFLVTPRKDLADWLRVMARCSDRPKGIITYGSSDIRLEDFVSEYRGDGDKLASQLRRVVKPQHNTLEWETVFGKAYDSSMKDRHVVSPLHLDKTKQVVLRDGKIAVID